MSRVPWPFWMLVAFVGLLFLGGLATELLFTPPTTGSLALWGLAAVGLGGGGYLWFRRLARHHQPFGERWEKRVAERTGDRDE
jgi:hypothetical protein